MEACLVQLVHVCGPAAQPPQLRTGSLEEWVQRQPPPLDAGDLDDLVDPPWQEAPLTGTKAAWPVTVDDEVDPHRLSQVIRRTIGKWVSDTYRRRPMIIPTVLEV